MFSMFQQIKANQAHELYHEAQRRAQLPQPVTKHRRPKSVLLPAPNNMIFELFNTIIKEIPAERLVGFITSNLRDYLHSNWSHKIVRQLVRRLRREQALDVHAGLGSSPMIKYTTGTQTSRAPTTIIDVRKRNNAAASSPPQSPPSALSGAPGSSQLLLATSEQPKSAISGQSGQRPLISRISVSATRRTTARRSPRAREASRRRETLIGQVYEHIMWRIQSDNVTQASTLLIKLALDDGYKRGKLKSEPYDDVLACFEDWRGQKLIKLYAFGAAPANDQRLVLASTQTGDLTKWVANYIDGTEKRQRIELIRILVAALRDKTKNCIFITNELIDAIRSLNTGALRCVFLVDRLNRYEPITTMPNFSAQIEPLLQSGKLYIMSSLDCVDFAPDPSSDNCC